MSLGSHSNVIINCNRIVCIYCIQKQIGKVGQFESNEKVRLSLFGIIEYTYLQIEHNHHKQAVTCELAGATNTIDPEPILQ